MNARAMMMLGALLLVASAACGGAQSLTSDQLLDELVRRSAAGGLDETAQIVHQQAAAAGDRARRASQLATLAGSEAAAAGRALDELCRKNPAYAGCPNFLVRVRHFGAGGFDVLRGEVVATSRWVIEPDAGRQVIGVRVDGVYDPRTEYRRGLTFLSGTCVEFVPDTPAKEVACP